LLVEEIEILRSNSGHESLSDRPPARRHSLPS
jgi:hypothetical protein